MTRGLRVLCYVVLAAIIGAVLTATYGAVRIYQRVQLILVKLDSVADHTNDFAAALADIGLLLPAKMERVTESVEGLTRAVENGQKDVRLLAGRAAETMGEVRMLRESLNGTIKGVELTVDRAHATMGKVESIVVQVDSALPLFLECDHNPDCAFNRFQGTSKAIEQSSMAVARMANTINLALPETVSSVHAIQSSVQDSTRTFALGFPRFVENTNGITENVNRLTRPRWWDTLIKGGVAGAIGVGELWPVLSQPKGKGRK